MRNVRLFHAFRVCMLFDIIKVWGHDEPNVLFNESRAVLFYNYALVPFCTHKRFVESWQCGPPCGNTSVAVGSPRLLGPGRYFGVQGFAAVLRGDAAGGESRRCIVGFRGTVSIRNCMADLDVQKSVIPKFVLPWPFEGAEWCEGCKVYAGFASAYEDVRKDVHEAVLDLKCDSVVFVGHSLGAAVATLASIDMRARGIRVPEVWTYGKPRVGNLAFLKAYVKAAREQRVHPPMWRIVHYHDRVPRLPPQWTGLQHEPLEVYYESRQFPSSSTVCFPEPDYSENKSCGWHDPWDIGDGPDKMWRDHMSYLGVSFVNSVGGPTCAWEEGKSSVSVFRLILDFPLFQWIILLLVMLITCAGCCFYLCCCRRCHRLRLKARSVAPGITNRDLTRACLAAPDSPCGELWSGSERSERTV
eukprot:TRINITY_DN2844_c0_g4_i1.p1 TRINITY_DN2844_c0_g4~~TRINITY_DN2844_c0_g4_i1.p1  ORF type:complete len:415 (+),score=15.09 TRINITY_DN2844_c0_g4_i1:108-1352(+)